MANYTSMTRSNYFKVTDTKKFKELVKGIAVADSNDTDTDIVCEDETGMCRIAGYGSLYCVAQDGAGDEDSIMQFDDANAFYEELSHIIAPGDAAIFTEIGSEKLRYLTATAVIVTRDYVECIDLCQTSIQHVRDLLNDRKWTTVMDY